jgi:nucleoside-diphosphate-sugar epimerase
VRKVAVIGANGFIGRAICSVLRRSSGVEVRALSRGDLDLTAPDSWSSINNGIDTIVNAVGAIDVPMHEAYRVNALAMISLAKICRRERIPNLVHLSTGAVRPMAEGSAGSARNDYATSKWLGEEILLQEHAGRLAIARLYFPYGPGQSILRLVPRIAAAVFDGRPIRCNPDGGPQLCLGHVDDTARLLAQDLVLGDVQGVIELASDRIYRIEELGRLIGSACDRQVLIDRTGSSPDVLASPYRPGSWRPFEPEIRSLLAAI